MITTFVAVFTHAALLQMPSEPAGQSARSSHATVEGPGFWSSSHGVPPMT